MIEYEVACDKQNSPTMEDTEPRVHYSNTSGINNNDITVEPMRHGHLKVHLGFLKIHRTYRIEFTIPWFTCVLHTEGAPAEPAMLHDEPNPHCQVIDFIRKDQDTLSLKIELEVGKEKFLNQPFQIKCCETGAPLTIHLNARVYAENEGRPYLRNGIESLTIEIDQSEDDDVDDNDKDDNDEDDNYEDDKYEDDNDKDDNDDDVNDADDGDNNDGDNNDDDDDYLTPIEEKSQESPIEK